MKTITIKCSHCNSPFQKAKNEYNRQQKRWNNDAKFFCSKQCLKEFKTLGKIELTCDECGKEYSIHQHEYNKKLRIDQQNFFCCKQCANTFIGKNLTDDQIKKRSIIAKKWCRDNYEKVLASSLKAFDTVRSKGHYFCSKGEIEVFEYLKVNSSLHIQTGGGFKIGTYYNKPVRKQFDIFCRETKTIIEYDGKCHFEPIYGKDAFKKTKMKDRLMKQWCKDNGWSLVRIREEVYKKSKQEWLDILLKHIEKQEVEFKNYY
jgi:very-short-patch-repair endonuclease